MIDKILEQFDENFPNSRGVFENGDPYNSRREAVKDFLKFSLEQVREKTIREMKRDVAFDVLNDYTSWLCKKGYCDSDVYTEEPKAVEEYWKENFYKINPA